ncbi:class I SAM-dependent methyltransferase [Novosphingobium sp.]|uniref:class I SAM-dependent methyltransferase n=1 Tax=Novosphingobium sp. TaxID=1874826 RepID=UPI0038BAA387
MTMQHELGQLAARRIDGLPVFCGAAAPGLIEVAEWHVWSLIPSTPDQLRIEAWLEGFALNGASILHVGAGNSLFAKRFCGHGACVTGTTVAREEVAHGESLAIPGYRVLLHNKYSGADGRDWPRFDFIVDNNPSSFGCCLDHYMAMLRFYADVLAPGGQVLVDRVGLGWSLSNAQSDARWGFAFEDLAATAELVGLRAFAVSPTIIALARENPKKPSYIRQLMRKIVRRLKGG